MINIDVPTIVNTNNLREVTTPLYQKQDRGSFYDVEDCFSISFYKKSSPLKEVNYEFRGQILGKVPTSLKSIVDCIKNSEGILTLEDNWDTEGSKCFSEVTWKSTAVFLLNYSREVNNILGYIVDTPKVYPGPNGSIDIDWETSNYGLIINIAEGGELATYYGDNKAQQMTEGIFDPRNFNIQLLPLAIQL